MWHQKGMALVSSDFVLDDGPVFAKVIKELSGSFAGGTSIAKYFLMEPIGRPSSFDSEETSEIKWATIDEATTLVGMTTNKIGKARDLSVLGAVRLALKL
jgi:hypothetical protein